MAENLILVACEQPSLLAELINKARQTADALGWKVAVAAVSENGVYSGADLVYTFGDAQLALNPESCVAGLTALCQQISPALVLVGGTKFGMEVAPRVAERCDAAYASGVVGFEVEGGQNVTAHCVLYTGLGEAKYQFKPMMTVLSCVAGAFKPVAAAAGTPAVQAVAAALPAAKMQVTAVKPKAGSNARIEEAKAIVDLGQGVKQREDLEMIHGLTSLVDGMETCTRPLASDRDWFPEWLGLSGKKVSPEVCFLIGISGAVQHIVGVRDSRVTVAVNSDENAGVFLDADYGVVADLYEFVPTLIERIKARGVRPVWLP